MLFIDVCCLLTWYLSILKVALKYFGSFCFGSGFVVGGLCLSVLVHVGWGLPVWRMPCCRVMAWVFVFGFCMLGGLYALAVLMLGCDVFAFVGFGMG